MLVVAVHDGWSFRSCTVCVCVCVCVRDVVPVVWLGCSFLGGSYYPTTVLCLTVLLCPSDLQCCRRSMCDCVVAIEEELSSCNVRHCIVALEEIVLLQ